MANSPAIAFMKDGRGRYVYVNETYLEHFKLRDDQIIGRTDFDLWSPTVARQFRANDLVVVTSGLSASVVEQVLEPDGTVQYWQVERFLLDQEGLLGGIGTNITGIKQHEALLEAQKAELDLLSSTDSLTGLKNRRGFWTEFEREWAYALRYRSPLSILMLDLDHFMQVNDWLGHSGGDKFLKAVGAVLSINQRTNDYAARFGGEEFIIMLPHTEAGGACILAERLREDIEAIGVTTVSIGVGCLTGEMTDPDDLIRAADKRLYHAKDSGRNWVRGPLQSQ